MVLFSIRTRMLMMFFSFLALEVLRLTEGALPEGNTKRNTQKSNECDSSPELGFLFDWESILEPCKYNLSWHNATEREKGQPMRTQVTYTTMIEKDIRLDGTLSKIVIQTYTAGGRRKKIGGDSWRATLKGTSQQMATVQDKMDGTYHVTFRIHENGRYKLEMILEQSMCDGLRDPPLGWFEHGDIHGHFQSPLLLGPNKDYILERKVFDISDVKEVKKAKLCERQMCLATVHPCKGWKEWTEKEKKSEKNNTLWKTRGKNRCRLVWDSFGAWYNVNEECKYLQKRTEKSLTTARDDKSLETLWIYGDSISQRWWRSRFRIDICKQLFKHCFHTYTFTYAERNFNKSHIDFGLPFNKSRFLKPIEIVLDNIRMQSEQSMLVINFGIHLILSLNFTELKDTIDKFAELIEKRRRAQYALPRIVWRTTTSTIPEMKHLRNTLSARFLTNHRIQLFNAYANSRLCSDGVDIFDVYTVTSANQNACKDGVHFSQEAFELPNKALEDYLQECILGEG